MMKPKTALVKCGFLPPGSENVRGRLSGAAIDKCKALVAEGWSIEGYVSAPSNATATTTVEKVAVDPNRMPDVPEASRVESEWTAHTSNGTVGMRTVCNICHSSLNYCHCTQPRVWISHESESMVQFKPTR